MIAHRSLAFLLPCFLVSTARGDDVTDGKRIEEAIEKEVNAIVEETVATIEEEVNAIVEGAEEAARGIEVEIEGIVADAVHRQHAELERQIRKGGADLFEERIHEPGDEGLRDVLLEMGGDPLFHDVDLDLDFDLLLDLGGEEEEEVGERGPRRKEEAVRRAARARIVGPGPARRKDLEGIEKQVERLEKEIQKLHEARRKMVLRGPKGLPEGGPEDGGPRALRGRKVSPAPQPRPEDAEPRARGRRVAPEPGFGLPVPPGPPGQRGPRPQMEAIRRELQNVRQGLERVERLIEELQRARGEVRGRQPDLFGQGGPGDDGPRPPAPARPLRKRQQPQQPGQPPQPAQPEQPGQPGPGPGNPYFLPRAPGGGPHVFHRDHVPHPPVPVPPPAPFHAALPAPEPHRGR